MEDKTKLNNLKINRGHSKSYKNNFSTTSVFFMCLSVLFGGLYFWSEFIHTDKVESLSVADESKDLISRIPTSNLLQAEQETLSIPKEAFPLEDQNGTRNPDEKLLDASGYVVARKLATVSSKTTGRIEEVLVEEGMRVDKGDILARLDSSSITIQLKLAESMLSRARADYEIAKSELREAELALNRVETLYRGSLVSEEDLDKAVIKVDILKARVKRQESEVLIAEQEIAQQKQFLSDNIIRAPFDGVVIDKNAQPGEIISPSSAGGGFTRTGICTLVDMSSLEIEVDVNESYINRVFEGQVAEAQLDAYPDWQIPAEVEAIVPTADRQKATIKVRLKFLESDQRILPDMGVRVSFYRNNIAAIGR